MLQTLALFKIKEQIENLFSLGEDIHEVLLISLFMLLEQPKDYLTVTTLTYLIKKQLEENFQTICLRGEVSNLKIQSSGHSYFTLKDSGAQISCVLFKSDGARLSSIFKEGDDVLIEGELNIYPPKGNYQIIARKVSPFGLGPLLLKFQNLKKELEERGWFNKEHKKLLPKLPKRIGVITSPTGAVIQDILHVLTRRFENFHLVLNPVKVQGEGASFEIAEAINTFNLYKLADVLIIARGGGSFEDLYPFNEEHVARAIFESQIPILSAIGHETDFTIADFVADVRAPTPSAAAELVLKDKATLLENLEKSKRFIDRTIQQQISYIEEKTENLKEALDRTFQKLIREIGRMIEGKKREVASTNPLMKIELKSRQLIHLMVSTDQAIRKVITTNLTRLVRLKDLLEAVNPEKLLDQGYSILFDEKNGSVIRNLDELSKSPSILARLKGGKALLNFIKNVDHD